MTHALLPGSGAILIVVHDHHGSHLATDNVLRNDSTIDSCNDALADQTTGCGTADNGPCCETAPVPNDPPTSCDDFTPRPGLCVDGVCEAQGCSDTSECPGPDGNCLGQSQCVNFACQPQPPVNDQGPCDNSGEGSGIGTCASGGCQSTDACGRPGDPACPDTDECNLGFCDRSGPGAWFCDVDPNLAFGNLCNNDTGICNGGTCEILRVIDQDNQSTAWRAAPILCSDLATPVCDAQSTNAGQDCPGLNSDCGDTPCDGPQAVSCNGNCLTDGKFEFIDGPGGRGGPRAGCELCLSGSCDGGSNNRRACSSDGECPGGQCTPATPGPPDCELDCFTFTCFNVLDPPVILPGGAPLSAAVYPSQVEDVSIRGCEVASSLLKNQLAIDTTVFLDVSSDGANNLTTSYNVSAANAGLALAAPLANLIDVTIETSVTPATPSFITQKLDPALQNTPTSDYIPAGIFTLTPNELPPAPQTVIPDAPPSLTVNFDPAGFLIEQFIFSYGAPFNITGAACTFNNPEPTSGDPMVFGVTQP